MAYMYAAGKALGTKDISSRLLFLVDNSIAKIDNVDFETIEARLLEIMKSASTMPEECKSLSQACEKCDQKRECPSGPEFLKKPIKMRTAFPKICSTKSNSQSAMNGY